MCSVFVCGVSDVLLCQELAWQRRMRRLYQLNKPAVRTPFLRACELVLPYWMEDLSNATLQTLPQYQLLLKEVDPASPYVCGSAPPASVAAQFRLLFETVVAAVAARSHNPYAGYVSFTVHVLLFIFD